ncbi:hypothetical protein J4230_05855 [Candidatus Woesearchaeota archaeon]|nr:hypothetical protein [Candidatus Woesearchaeota archaeon]
MALSIFNINCKNLFEVRGEDVPFWIQQFQDQGKKAIGFTGEDLYTEFNLETDYKLEILKRIEWDDEMALFGKPALCLIGSKNYTLQDLPKNLIVCLPYKYKNVANKYLKSLEDQGFTFKKIYVNGCVEMSCSEGIADLIIDIVYTGNSLFRYGLQVYDKIMYSDFLILGTKESLINQDKEV